jgi:hypothetical protein
MFRTEVRKVTGNETPKLAIGDARSVVAQELARRRAGYGGQNGKCRKNHRNPPIGTASQNGTVGGVGSLM